METCLLSFGCFTMSRYLWSQEQTDELCNRTTDWNDYHDRSEDSKSRFFHHCKNSSRLQDLVDIVLARDYRKPQVLVHVRAIIRQHVMLCNQRKAEHDMLYSALVAGSPDTEKEKRRFEAENYSEKVRLEVLYLEFSLAVRDERLDSPPHDAAITALELWEEIQPQLSSNLPTSFL